MVTLAIGGDFALNDRNWVTAQIRVLHINQLCYYEKALVYTCTCTCSFVLYNVMLLNAYFVDFTIDFSLFFVANYYILLNQGPPLKTLSLLLLLIILIVIVS